MRDVEVLKRRHKERLIEFSFRSVFHRLPEGEEAEKYLNRLQDGVSVLQLLQEMRGEIAEEFIQADDWNASEKPEATCCVIDDLIQLPDEDYVEAIYQRFLGRRADVDGKRFFCNHLANGGSRLQTAEDLANSAEGQQYRQTAIAAKNDLENEKDSKLSFAANVFACRFHALAEVS